MRRHLQLTLTAAPDLKLVADGWNSGRERGGQRRAREVVHELETVEPLKALDRDRIELLKLLEEVANHG